MVKIRLMAMAAVICAGGCSHTLGDVHHLKLEQTPPAVMEGFTREFPGLTLSHMDEITYLDGTVKYEAKFRDVKNGYHRKMFSKDGVLLDPKWGVSLASDGQPVHK